MKDARAVPVAVAVVSDSQQRQLWIWNDQWGAFALPMTKLRRGPNGQETPARAAVRAGAEALGVPVRITPGTLRLPLLRECFSGRQQMLRQYAYQIFGIEPHPDFADRMTPRTPHLWLTAAQALESGYEPLSESSRDILDRVLLVLPPTQPLRRSRAALAVVSRPASDGRPLWLAQWNYHWKCFHFIGGHKHHDETFRQRLLREIASELPLQEKDFVAEEQPLAQLTYTAFSERYQAETNYQMELYRVRLRGVNALDRVLADPLNRWLSADEIRAGRCGDGQPISETMGQLLEQVGWPGN